MEFSESLKKNRDFQNVYRRGRSFADRYYVMYVWPNGTSVNRLGISVRKKVGNSVVRHHVARLVREAYRLNEGKFSCGYDIVVVGRAACVNASYHDTERSLLHQGGRHGIMRETARPG